MAPFFILLFLLLLLFCRSSSSSSSSSSPCSDRCGNVQIPVPFHLGNSTCGPRIDAFRLACPTNATGPFLLLAPSSALRVLDFRPAGTLLLDYSSNASSCDRWYSDLARSAVFAGSPFFAITANNVLRLYDCEDSSICKTGCEEIRGGCGGCEGNGTTRFGCCYPLSDGSVWKMGDGFGVFAEFGCRGFSSWVVGKERDGAVARRGIEVEWAVPRGYRNGEVCGPGAVIVNATGVGGGIRCSCGAGLAGDGFREGSGCSEVCSNDWHPTGKDCCRARFCKKKVVILCGLFIFGFVIAAVVAFWFLMRRSSKAKRWDLDPACIPKILGSTCRTRLFSYEELNEATKGFEDNKQVAVVDGVVHTGVLDDGTLIAIQRVKCESQQNLRQVLERVELLAQISHRNIAKIIGCSIHSSYTLLLVHEFCSCLTLEGILEKERGNGLNWYNRIHIATEIASALSYLQCEVAPSVCLQDLTSRDIFVEANCSVKISSFKFLDSGSETSSSSVGVTHDARAVHGFGLILLELVVGSKCGEILEIVLPKIKDNKFCEVVDPYLGYAAEFPIQREQIETVAGLAAKCLLSRENEGLCMVGIAKELIHILNGYPGSSSQLQETFSNSSLLQMISMSPDYIHSLTKNECCSSKI